MIGRETQHEENVSHQVWSRHEQFLRRKKHEDEIKNCHTLTILTWEEQLERRLKPEKSPDPKFVKNCNTITAPFP